MSTMRYSYALSLYGDLCRRGRSQLGMTKIEMARKMGIPAIEIEKVERGLVAPSEQYIVNVAGILGQSMDDVTAALNASPERNATNNILVFPGRRP